MGMRGWTGNRGVLVSAVVVLTAGVAVGGVQAANASSAALPAPAAAPVVAALAVPAPGTVQGGIVVEGVTGEGTAIAGGIDVVKFSDLVKSPVTAGGGGAGKPQVADLQVTGAVEFFFAFRQITWKFLRNGTVVSQSQFTVV